ncbi:reticulon-4 receptor-like [Ochlerotatus camptorhynchus]|uniref:reticulon-4 receptor-like n=1 Tax=Ochlerotatus camptorhynchus TaxID=644619 RepID=UPI0031DA8065
MDLFGVLWYWIYAAVPPEITWNLKCGPRATDVCELQNCTITSDTNRNQIFFPATNLMINHGYVPHFDASVAQMLRQETIMLAIMNSGVQDFVIREMIEILILEDNQIERMDVIEGQELFRLKILKVSRNRLTDISFVRKLSKLKYLHAHDNQLEAIPMKTFENGRDLVEVWLHNNRIKKLETTAMLTLKNLWNLELQNNQLQELDAKWWRFDNLQSINLDGNLLQSLNGAEFKRAFPTVLNISVANNPWNCDRLRDLKYHFVGGNVNLLGVCFEQKCCHNDRLDGLALGLAESLEHLETAYGEVRGIERAYVDANEQAVRLEKLQKRFDRVEFYLRHVAERLEHMKEKYDCLRYGKNKDKKKRLKLER